MKLYSVAIVGLDDNVVVLLIKADSVVGAFNRSVLAVGIEPFYISDPVTKTVLWKSSDGPLALSMRGLALWKGTDQE